MDVLMRRADRSDVEEILEIYKPYVLNTNVTFEYDVPTREEFAQRFMSIAREFPWLVCETGGRIVGYAYAERTFARAAYQWDADIAVYLREDAQGQGIAGCLYRAVESFLKRMGYVKLYALVTSENERSMRFHEKMGYKKIAVFPETGYKRGAWLGVVWYEKCLCSVAANPSSPISFSELGEEEIKKVLF